MSNYVVIDGDRYDFKNVSKITEDSCSICALKNFCDIDDTPCSVFNASEIIPNRTHYSFVKHVKFQNNGKEIIKNKVMTKYINKDALVAEIERLQDSIKATAIDGRISKEQAEVYKVCVKLRNFVEDTLEVKDPYEQCVQYDSIKAGIQANAEIYSFNIESKLFNQLTKEQQALWRKEIEQACVSGGEVGVELARDTRYKENFEVKEVDLNEEIERFVKSEGFQKASGTIKVTNLLAKHFFELGLKSKVE